MFLVADSKLRSAASPDAMALRYVPALVLGFAGARLRQSKLAAKYARVVRSAVLIRFDLLIEMIDQLLSLLELSLEKADPVHGLLQACL
jgi:hypothetical protein